MENSAYLQAQMNLQKEAVISEVLRMYLKRYVLFDSDFKKTTLLYREGEPHECTMMYDNTILGTLTNTFEGSKIKLVFVPLT